MEFIILIAFGLLLVVALIVAAGVVLLIVRRSSPSRPSGKEAEGRARPETLRCPVCGNDIPPGSPQGQCPRCLLRVAIEDPATSMPLSPPTAAYSPGFTPATPEELAAAFPQLEILELLGKGGMGAVYKARQPHLDRMVALKVLPPDSARDPAFAERFAREARALARLNHPNIVGVHDFGQNGGHYFLLMEYVDGVNLRQAMRAGQLTPQEALRIVPQLCEALQFAHDEGVVHRDIKPENILLDKRGRVKVADFGLAKLLGQSAVDSGLTGTHQVMGTMHYMAPEQLAGARAVDHRADIYSLGATFYEMLTGELPLGHFPPPSKTAGIDVRLDHIVLRTLEREPADRYQHASDVKTEVESISSTPTPARGATSDATQPFERRPSLAPPPSYALSVGIPTVILVAIYVLAACCLLVVGGINWLIGILLCAGIVVLGATFGVLNLVWLARDGHHPAQKTDHGTGGPPEDLRAKIRHAGAPSSEHGTPATRMHALEWLVRQFLRETAWPRALCAPLCLAGAATLFGSWVYVQVDGHVSHQGRNSDGRWATFDVYGHELGEAWTACACLFLMAGVALATSRLRRSRWPGLVLLMGGAAAGALAASVIIQTPVPHDRPELREAIQRLCYVFPDRQAAWSGVSDLQFLELASREYNIVIKRSGGNRCGTGVLALAAAIVLLALIDVFRSIPRPDTPT